MVITEIAPAAVTRARVEVSLGATITRSGRYASATDPAAATTYYHVPSRDGAHTHEVVVTGTASGVQCGCSCPAGEMGRACWHVGLAALALAGEVEARLPRRMARAARAA